ncbi:MAG: hypothetical protein KQA41_00290 [Candidatus Aenigmarchaeota archaeon]|nr:hypothetical protein [Candidatus Aenigmarchaeota archaeon]
MSKGTSLAIGIGEFISLLVLIGIILLIISFVFRDVLVLKIEKENYIEKGKTINLANSIITESNIVSLDELGQKRKGIINITELEKVSNIEKPLKCCEYVDYDYYANIKINSKNQNYLIGYKFNDLKELFQLEKICIKNTESKTLEKIKIPLIVQDQDKMYDASMEISLAKTPISYIATELNVACIKDNYQNTIPIYGFNQYHFWIEKKDNTYTVCTRTYKDVFMCKDVFCEKNIKVKKIEGDCRNDDKKCLKGCSYFFDNDCKLESCGVAKIISKSNEVVICFANTEKELEQC